MLDGKSNAGPVPELVPMYPRGKPAMLCGAEHSFRRRLIKGTDFAEHIDRAHERCDRFKHGAGHLIEERLFVETVGHHVRAEERHRIDLLCGDLGTSYLVRDGQSIPSFGFHGGGSAAHALGDEASKVRGERLVRG